MNDKELDRLADEYAGNTELNFPDEIAEAFKAGHKSRDEEFERLEYNYSLREKELQDLKDSLPETHWAYWRKRACEMTSAWQDRGELIKSITEMLAIAEETMEFYSKPKSFAIIYDDESRNKAQIYEIYGENSIGDIGIKAEECISKISGIKKIMGQPTPEHEEK